MKKKIAFFSIIISIIVIAITSIRLYSTYATDPVVPNDSYTITLTGDTTVSVPRFSYKDVIYQIKNTTDGTVNYGVGFTSNNSTTKVKTFADSTDPATGTITENNYKYVKLRIENYSDDTETVTISTILGYENGGDLVVPSGVTQVTSTTDGTYIVNSATNTTYFYISALTRANIESIEYVKLSDMPLNTTTSNISSDNSVRLWYELNEDTNLYKVYIGTLTGKVKMPSSMGQMFYGLKNVTNLDLSMFDTSNVTWMRQTFYGCTKLKNVDISSFEVPLLTEIGSMFQNCNSLEEADLSTFNPTNLTSFGYVFFNCTHLKKVNLSGFNFSNITMATGNNSPFRNVPSSVEIIVTDCNQVTEFKSKGLGLNNVHTFNNEICG